MKKIIVSGITGFVGVNLFGYFNDKYEILGISRNRNARKKLISYDLVNKELLSSSYAFIHLAGKAHDLKRISKDSEYFEVNTELTKRLFDQFLKSDLKVFIYMSSVKAVADGLDGVLTEDVFPNPLTPYGKSKLAAEKYILSKELPNDKRLYILRPCMIHGPNNKGNLNLLYTLVSKGIPYPFGEFKNQRSFLTIENLCFVISELLENPIIPSGIYNIADDEPLSTVELVKIIGESQNQKVKVLNISPKFMQMLAKIGDYFPLILSSEKLQKLTESYVVSNKKIKQAIKKELPLSTIEGLEQTFKNYDKNL